MKCRCGFYSTGMSKRKPRLLGRMSSALHTTLEGFENQYEDQDHPDDILYTNMQNGLFIQTGRSNLRCDGNFFADDFEKILQKSLFMFQEYFSGKWFCGNCFDGQP